MFVVDFTPNDFTSEGIKWKKQFAGYCPVWSYENTPLDGSEECVT